jgi:hypothetical protein
MGTEQKMPALGTEKIWNALSGDLGSLTSFFDALKIHNKLKVDKQFELGFESGAKAGWEKDGFKGICVDAGIKVPVPIGRIWGWILEKLPGHRYVKVLTRLKLIEHQYPRFERHLQKIWSNAWPGNLTSQSPREISEGKRVSHGGRGGHGMIDKYYNPSHCC